MPPEPDVSTFAPGAVIGIMGGGQLGRMIALAAASLGYRCHIFSPEADSPAAQVAARATVADYQDAAALERFAAEVQVVTFEFENIPVAALERLSRLVPVRPRPEVLRITQDRLLEKDYVRSTGAATAPYAALSGEGEIAAAVAAAGPRAVLKTRRMGYDGKGQRTISAADPMSAGEAVAAAWDALGRAECILEGFVDFACEISVVVARGIDGALASYVPVENRHARHILDVTIAPARVPAEVASEAERVARAIAVGLDLVGVMAVEMFVTRDGRILVNETAPRVHNSGHWTIEGCLTSQFEQQVRAVAGLPLGSPQRLFNARMKNLIGDDIQDWPKLLAEPSAKLHLYGKAEPRPGRKMGHVTRLYPLNANPE